MLEVENLHAGYGRIGILAGVSFTIARGELVGVLGHNGMGKTTLLKTLVGELSATVGVIRSRDWTSPMLEPLPGRVSEWATFHKGRGYSLA